MVDWLNAHIGAQHHSKNTISRSDIIMRKMSKSYHILVKGNLL